MGKKATTYSQENSVQLIDFRSVITLWVAYRRKIEKKKKKKKPSSPSNFSAFSLVVIYMAICPLGRAYAIRSLVVIILFFIRQAFVFQTPFFGACFFISFTKIMLLSLTIILLFLLQKKERFFALATITSQVCSFIEAIIAAYCFLRIVSLYQFASRIDVFEFLLYLRWHRAATRRFRIFETNI